MAATAAAAMPTFGSQLKKIAWWEIGIGIFCLVAPIWSSLAITYAIGIGLVIIGALLFREAWGEAKGTKGRGWRFVEGAAFVFLGLYFVLNPLAGMATITAVIASLLILTGLVRLFAAFEVRPANGWGMLALAGVAAVLCGVLFLVGLPFSGLWVPGILFGASLLSGGIAHLTLAKALA